MLVFVTGGTGYIGSHTSAALLNSGFDIVIADNFHNSDLSVITKIKNITKKDFMFHEIDVTDKNAVESIFKQYNFDGVIHFAGYKSVEESIRIPLDYYNNNIMSTMTVAAACVKYNVNRFIFSSSATVYGDNQSPFSETMELREARNPYGKSKSICEQILQDLSNANPEFSVALLRYFNPVGAHESGMIGDMPKGRPNNLMPYITQVALRKREKLQIFGNDYPTLDGTGVRDYIHVMDLAEGHVRTLSELKRGVCVYNLGTGRGVSVLQLLKTFEEVNGVQVPYEFSNRRPGDLAVCYADVEKARKELSWFTKRDVSDMCKDAWNFEMLSSGNYQELMR